MGGKPNGGVFNPINLSMFSYSSNNPINILDPNGEEAVDPQEVYKDTVGNENFIPYMYLDTSTKNNKSKVTVGVGTMLPDSESVKDLSFKKNTDFGKRLATPTEKKSAWNTINDSVDGVNTDPASDFEADTNIRLDYKDAKQIAINHIKKDARMANKAFPGFDDMPKSAQKAVLDMSYNLGISKRGVSKFPSFSAHLKSGNFFGAAAESYRKGISNERNANTLLQLIGAGIENMLSN